MMEIYIYPPPNKSHFFKKVCVCMCVCACACADLLNAHMFTAKWQGGGRKERKAVLTPHVSTANFRNPLVEIRIQDEGHGGHNNSIEEEMS